MTLLLNVLGFQHLRSEMKLLPGSTVVHDRAAALSIWTQTTSSLSKLFSKLICLWTLNSVSWAAIGTVLIFFVSEVVQLEHGDLRCHRSESHFPWQTRSSIIGNSFLQLSNDIFQIIATRSRRSWGKWCVCCFNRSFGSCVIPQKQLLPWINTQFLELGKSWKVS